MKGVILHGSAGTRLRPLSFTGPKQLVPIANRPVSHYVLEDLLSAGVRNIAIILVKFIRNSLGSTMATVASSALK